MMKKLYPAAPCAAALVVSVLTGWTAATAHAEDTTVTSLPSATTGGAAAGSSPTLLNPAMSLDGLFALAQFNRWDPVVFEGGHDPQFSGFNMQQVELSFNANVDPYLRADANIVLTPQGIEVEEAYATTLDLPWNLQIKAGQFFTAFGRENPTHPHTWNYVNKPLVLGRFFGGDGLRNPGAQVSWLTPLPWYAELITSIQNSTGSTVPSFRPDPPGGGPNPDPMRTLGDGIWLVRLNNFFTLSDTMSLNVGASALEGANNQGAGDRTRIFGGDLFFKYRQPDSLSYFAVTFEAMERYYDLTYDPTNLDYGWYVETDFRLDAPWERWHVGLRYDYVGPRGLAPSTVLVLPGSQDYDTLQRYRISPVVTFYPSEFSKVRLEYDYDAPAALASAQQAVTLQLEFLIGAHGAHKF